MTGFSIDGRQYRARPFDADVHISLMLKLGPLFTSMAAVMPDVLAARQRNSEPDQPFDPIAMMAALGFAVGPVAERLAALDRQGDTRPIIDACLQAADQDAEDKWHQVMTKSGTISNRDNASYAAKLQITMGVLRINFGPMLRGRGIDLDILMGGTPDEAV